jgi:hypothetical protein
MDRHPWEAIKDERALAFSAFEIYRRLGPNRTVEQAWRLYWNRPGTRRKRGDNTSPPRVMPYFSKWAVQWRWRERALAWDAEQTAIERDQRLDRELREKAKEHEEELRQRQLWKEEARAARTLARRLLMRGLQGIDAREIEDMGVREILPHSQRLAALLEVGQRLERMALGEPTDVVRQVTALSPELQEKLLALLQRYVPPDRWQELAQELTTLDEEKTDELP